MSHGGPSRLTFDASADGHPIWSPDGQTIVFRSTRGTGVWDLYQKPASGAGAETLLLASPQSKFPQDWSADGHALLYTADDPKTGRDLWILPLDGDRTPRPFVR